MSLRDKLKNSVKLHEVDLSVGKAFVVAFFGRKRAEFVQEMAVIRDTEKDTKKRDELINALTVAISLVDKSGKFPYCATDYKSVIKEMLSVDIEKVVLMSLDINGLSGDSIGINKKKSKKKAK